MPTLLDDCDRLFGGRQLYDILSLQSTAAKAEIKKAYYRLSLMVHPDRVEKDSRAEATEKFKVLGKIYEILSDDDKRAIYDESGSVDDEMFEEKERDWSAYWRLLFPKINLKDVKEFEATYRDSDEELKDLKAAYVSCKGDMDSILNSVMCCTMDDEPRFRETLTQLIEADQLPRFDSFFNESKTKQNARKRKAEREKKEAERALKELKQSSVGVASGEPDSSLSDLIQSRQAMRQDDFLSHLEQKYAASGKSKNKKDSATSKEQRKPSRK